jgi:predicted RND superfamily exporter protein
MAAAVGLVLLSLAGVKRIGLDTDLVRLLPRHSPAASWTRALAGSIGDGGYFTVILQGEDREGLLRAVRRTAAALDAHPAVRSVEYRYPIDFIRHYRYLLIPVDYLDRIYGHVLGLEAEFSPFADNLAAREEKPGGPPGGEGEELKKLIAQYANLSEYHENRDGTVMGIFIRPGEGFTNLRATRSLYSDIGEIARETSREFGVWADVGGSQINNLREYDVVLADLRRSGLIASAAILLTLFLGFRSFAVIPVLLFPLAAGILWAFALVPFVVGDLNTITAFLLMILFGMGIDYSIHLLKRFQLELVSKAPEAALEEVYLSTGKSVIVSGLTTALPLFIMGVSDFRGFAEFGIIGGGAILVILAAMIVVMPAALILGRRLGLIKGRVRTAGRTLLPARGLVVVLVIALGAAAVSALSGLRFDYDFDNLGVSVPQSQLLRQRHKEVYPGSMSPGAVYVVPGLDSLDSLRALFRERSREEGSTIARVSSVRDFAPDARDAAERLELIGLIGEELEGAWVKRIEDEEIREWIRDFREWTPLASPPSVAEIPDVMKRGLMTRDGSGKYVLGVYPNIPRRDGREAMRFARELYDLQLPAGVEGPVGEMPVFAEILWLVTRDGPLVIAATLLGVVLIVFLGCRSVKDTAWTVFPLLGGMALALGILPVFGFKLNFFNVVVIPALLGLGIDHGVHYYRRWKELGRDAAGTQRELFGPLTTCTLTTMMGYSGMAFANHEGLRSIGLVACLGLAAIWLTSLILFPGILHWASRTRRRADG